MKLLIRGCPLLVINNSVCLVCVDFCMISFVFHVCYSSENINGMIVLCNYDIVVVLAKKNFYSKVLLELFIQ